MKPREAIDNNTKTFGSLLLKYMSVLFGVTAVIVVYLVLKHHGHIDLIKLVYDLFMLKYLPSLGSDSSYGLLFVLGILTSVHCIGMCGGIAISQTINKGESLQGEKKDIKVLMLPSALYNFGKVLSYTFVGGLVGALGQVLSLNGFLKGVVPIVGGVLMVIMGIKLLGIFPALRKFNIPVPTFVAKRLLSKNNYTPFIVGILTGLMPCGPLQIVQLYALGTRSFFVGALSMFVFSMGTFPLLFLFGILNSFISKKNSNKIFKLSAVLVIVLGVVMVGRGLALSGISLNFGNYDTAVSEGVAIIEGDFQRVVTKLEPGSYSPIAVQRGIPVKWIITADKESLNQCNNEIIIPKLNISKKLTEGDNVIEFTAESEGEIVYTCWMGMIKSSIYVVSDLKDIPKDVNFLGSSQGKRENMSCNMGNLPGEYVFDTDDNSSNEKCAMPNEKCDMEEEQCFMDEKQTKINSGSGKEIVEPVKETSQPIKETSQPIKETYQPIKVETWEGYLIDRHCFGMIEPQKETRACLLMDECADSGYGIAVKQDDGNYKFLVFDEKGHNLAFEQLNKLTRNSGFKTVVRGSISENTIKVSELLIESE